MALDVAVDFSDLEAVVLKALKDLPKSQVGRVFLIPRSNLRFVHAILASGTRHSIRSCQLIQANTEILLSNSGG